MLLWLYILQVPLMLFENKNKRKLHRQDKNNGINNQLKSVCFFFFLNECDLLQTSLQQISQLQNVSIEYQKGWHTSHRAGLLTQLHSSIWGGNRAQLEVQHVHPISHVRQGSFWWHACAVVISCVSLFVLCERGRWPTFHRHWCNLGTATALYLDSV